MDIKVNVGDAKIKPETLSGYQQLEVCVLYYDISKYSLYKQILICSCGVFVFYVLYGYLQELLFTIKLEGYDGYGWYLTLVQFAFYSVFGLVELRCQETIPQRRVPIKAYCMLAFLTLGTMGFSNSSLAFLNYPTQVIFKSCKLIPVMIGSIIIQQKKYNVIDYSAAFLMSAGLTLFTLADSRVSPNFSFIDFYDRQHEVTVHQQPSTSTAQLTIAAQHSTSTTKRSIRGLIKTKKNARPKKRAKKKETTKKRTICKKKTPEEIAKMTWCHSIDFSEVENAGTAENENREPQFDRPVDYFYSFFTDQLLEMIVYQSNLYSAQKTGESANITKDNLVDFLSVTILLGVVPFPAYTDAWSGYLRYEKIASIMPLKTYQKVRRFIHFVDNSQPHNGDRYYKVRPVMESIRQSCLKLDGGEGKYSIDESMCKYKGKKSGSLRQYMKDKPTKWGYKFFLRSGISGMIFDFMPFAGAATFQFRPNFTNEEQDYLFSEKCIITLVKTIPDPTLKAVYMDNFYSSVRLMLQLRANYGLLCLGTFRNNRTGGASQYVLKSDRELMSLGRGSTEQVVHKSGKMTIIKWVDNKVVTIGSTYVGITPPGKVKRWSKGKNERENVPCPKAVLEYNKFMGGVDLTDMFVSLHRSSFRSHRYYTPIFTYLLDIALINSWLLFKKDANENITFKRFKIQVADELVALRRQKKNRSSKSPTPPRPASTVPVPLSSVRDGVGHLPVFRKRGRCRLCQINNTNVHCEKCNIRLCLTIKRNCFHQLHS